MVGRCPRWARSCAIWLSATAAPIRSARTHSGWRTSSDGWRRGGSALEAVDRSVVSAYIADYRAGVKGGATRVDVARIGRVDGRTRKPAPALERQPATVNHRLAVLASFFSFVIARDRERGAGRVAWGGESGAARERWDGGLAWDAGAGRAAARAARGAAPAGAATVAAASGAGVGGGADRGGRLVARQVTGDAVVAHWAADRRLEPGAWPPRRAGDGAGRSGPTDGQRGGALEGRAR